MSVAVLLSLATIGQPSLAEAADRGLASVVTVDAICEKEPHAHPEWLGQLLENDVANLMLRQRVHGSAVVITADGLLLTSRHLVDRAERISVFTPDGRELRAELAGSDLATDIAVLRVRPGDQPLQPIEIGDSNAIRPGDFVLAIGDPFLLGASVTLGVVSSKGKFDVGVVEVEEMIQTDAAINPGSSGGALVDARGRLIGINTAILTRTGVNQGIGFVVPVDVALPIALALARDGHVRRGWIGADLQDLDAPLREALQVPSRSGVVITQVIAGSPAQKAGLIAEDFVVAIDGHPITNTGRMRNLIARQSPGSRVTLEIFRGGRRQAIAVVLGQTPEEKIDAPGPRGRETVLGARLTPLDALSRKVFSIPDAVKQGVVVVDLEEGAIAELSELQLGDVIIELDRRAITDPELLENAWRGASRPLLLKIVREERARYLALPGRAAFR